METLISTNRQSTTEFFHLKLVYICQTAPPVFYRFAGTKPKDNKVWEVEKKGHLQEEEDDEEMD